MQSRENLRISVFLPSRCYQKKVRPAFFVSVRAVLLFSRLDNDDYSIAAAPSCYTEKARVPVSVCPRGVCHTNGPAIHTRSQPASSECVVSIRLLPPLVVLCQGKTANRVFFFRLVSVFELLLDFTAARAAALRRCVPKIEILICDFY